MKNITLAFVVLFTSMSAVAHETHEHKTETKPAERQVVVKEKTCDVNDLGVGAFCTFVERNVTRAAWSARQNIDIKIQNKVNRKINDILSKF